MTYLIVIFISPLYFLMRGKWLGFIVNLFFYGLAVLCLISIIGIFIAPIFWFIAASHGAWVLRTELMQENAEIIANAMAAKFQAQSGSSVSPRG